MPITKLSENLEKGRGNDVTVSLSKRQQELQEELSRAVQGALPWAIKVNKLIERAQSQYKSVAEVLVALRHEFPGPDGQPHDLRGRSAGYRMVVRSAYVQAGAESNGPVEKRLTAGVAYWVRKLLVETYGEQKLREMGVISEARGAKAKKINDNGLSSLADVVGALNLLASDPNLIPTEELVRSAIRAANLLQQRLVAQEATDQVVKIAV